MRASDRQQLDAVHRVKEELLRTDGKLLNGNHENGDLDPTSPLENTDCIQDKEEVNGVDGICFESEESKTEWKETPCIPKFVFIFIHLQGKKFEDSDLKSTPTKFELATFCHSQHKFSKYCAS